MDIYKRFINARRLSEVPGLEKALEAKRKESQQNSLRQGKHQSYNDIYDVNTRSILDLASLYPYEPVYRIFDRMKNVSPAQQNKIITALLKKKLIETDQVRLSRSTLRLITITEKGWAYLNKSAVKQGRGSMIHQHFANWIFRALTQRGYNATVEMIVPGTNHPVDVGVYIDKELHAYEVIVNCIINISSHIKACFVDSHDVRSLTIVTAQQSLHSKIRKYIENDMMAHDFLDRIAFETITPYLQEAFS